MSLFYKNLFTIKSLLDSGVHYGHSKNRWNPKMARYIYGVRKNIHIIDLEQTAQLLEKALYFAKDIVAQNGRVLFVSTKQQASDLIKEYATKCGQYYVNHRWLGGMLTNWSTVSASIKVLREYERMLEDQKAQMTKKERLVLQRKHDKLQMVLGGIRHLGGLPDMIFVIGIKEHMTAIKEAVALGIPVCAIADTNVDPSDVKYIIPGNDDACKSIELYCQLMSEAILMGQQENLLRVGTQTTRSGNSSNRKDSKENRNGTRDYKKKNEKSGVKKMDSGKTIDQKNDSGSGSKAVPNESSVVSESDKKAQKEDNNLENSAKLLNETKKTAVGTEVSQEPAA